MRKFWWLILLLLLSMEVQAKTAVFVSKYSSRSMDANTLDYYERVEDFFSEVLIVQESEVERNSGLWKGAYENADLIFVISLSEEMFSVSRDTFCGNLSVPMTHMKGFVFVGSSSMVNDSTFGCIYTQFFSLANPSMNTELRNDSLKLITRHEVCRGFELNKTYTIGKNNSIYTVIDPKKGMILGTVGGDPDGPGPTPPGDYPFLVVWEGIGHRTGVWGIETSSLEGCDGCIGWKLFDQLLEWASDTRNMGYKLYTDKEVYYPEERIYVDVKSPAEIEKVTGRLYYPDGRNYTLSFMGYGKEWYSIYLLDEKDPSGNYTVEVIADGVEKTRTIWVKPFDLNLNIDNTTRDVTIDVNVTDRHGNPLSVNLSINITSPSGFKSDYRFENIDSISFSYHVPESGEYTILVNATDAHGRSLFLTKYFSFRFKPNITFVPQDFTGVVHGSENLTGVVNVFNVGDEAATNLRIIRYGVIGEWIELKNETLGRIEPKSGKSLRFEIRVPELGVGNYTGGIKFLFDSEEYDFPIHLRMKYRGNLSVHPEYWSGWLAEGGSRTVELFLSNSGKGEVMIESISLTGNLSGRASIVEQPSIIEPNANRSLKILIDVKSMIIEDLVEELNGKLKIVTDEGVHRPSTALRVMVVGNLKRRSNELSAELSELEKNVSSLGKYMDVSPFMKSLNEIKSMLSEIEDSYDQGDYENAVESLMMAESRVVNLRSEVMREYTRIRKKEETYWRIIILSLLLVAATTVSTLLIKKMRKEKKYVWLYKKWKRITSVSLLFCYNSCLCSKASLFTFRTIDVSSNFIR